MGVGRVVRILFKVAPLAAVLVGTFAATWPALASDPIVPDGAFSDWVGQMNVIDPLEDVKNSRFDIVKFWWADNNGDASIYLRVDRFSRKSHVRYLIHVDTNNNGVFTEHVDREVLVFYRPRNMFSEVDVTVRYADTDGVIGQVMNQDWGEDQAEGGRYVEFKVPFADLGISVNQTIRMYVESANYSETPWDRTPDTGDIQWSPVNIMGYALLSIIMLGGAILIWSRKGRYVWATR